MRLPRVHCPCRWLNASSSANQARSARVSGRQRSPRAGGAFQAGGMDSSCCVGLHEQEVRAWSQDRLKQQQATDRRIIALFLPELLIELVTEQGEGTRAGANEGRSGARRKGTAREQRGMVETGREGASLVRGTTKPRPLGVVLVSSDAAGFGCRIGAPFVDDPRRGQQRGSTLWSARGANRR